MRKQLLAFCLLFFPAAIALAKEAPSPESRLQAYLAKTLPARGLSLDCVNLIREETTAKYADIAVRERHEGKCPGDPAVSPIVDRYRVPFSKGRIQTYDAAEDSWR